MNRKPQRPRMPEALREAVWALLREGNCVREVMRQTGVAESTVWYLAAKAQITVTRTARHKNRKPGEYWARYVSGIKPPGSIGQNATPPRCKLEQHYRACARSL